MSTRFDDIDLSLNRRNIHVRHLRKLRSDILSLCSENKLNTRTTTVTKIVKLISNEIKSINDKTKEINHE